MFVLKRTEPKLVIQPLISPSKLCSLGGKDFLISGSSTTTVAMTQLLNDNAITSEKKRASVDERAKSRPQRMRVPSRKRKSAQRSDSKAKPKPKPKHKAPNKASSKPKQSSKLKGGQQKQTQNNTNRKGQTQINNNNNNNNNNKQPKQQDAKPKKRSGVKRRTKSTIFGAKKPKRPKTAYNYFQLSIREQLWEELNQKQKINEAKDRVVQNEKIARVIGKRWKALTKVERAVYQTMADRDKKRYARENTEYIESLRSRYETKEKKRDKTVSSSAAAPTTTSAATTSVAAAAEDSHRDSDRINKIDDSGTISPNSKGSSAAGDATTETETTSPARLDRPSSPPPVPQRIPDDLPRLMETSNRGACSYSFFDLKMTPPPIKMMTPAASPSFGSVTCYSEMKELMSDVTDVLQEFGDDWCS
mmetsp:Transcript_26801/g.47453  ORF Transcript_26801/g.47453 Transcript_26801/m.47453 type:complete len:418 (-) Transcript_26801:578-1831(-)